MRRVAFVLLCVLAAPLAAVVANHYSCNRHEAAFQAKFQQVSWDACEGLKVGTPKGEALRFFSENHLGGWSDQSQRGVMFIRRGAVVAVWPSVSAPTMEG